MRLIAAWTCHILRWSAIWWCHWEFTLKHFPDDDIIDVIYLLHWVVTCCLRAWICKMQWHWDACLFMFGKAKVDAISVRMCLLQWFVELLAWGMMINSSMWRQAILHLAVTLDEWSLEFSHSGQHNIQTNVTVSSFHYPQSLCKAQCSALTSACIIYMQCFCAQFLTRASVTPGGHVIECVNHGRVWKSLLPHQRQEGLFASTPMETWRIQS